MSEISTKAELSKIYTNHCIRATTSTVLSHQNFNQNDIISVTGHKDPKSLMPYVASTSSNIRREMSSVLMNYGKLCKASEVLNSSSNSYIVTCIDGARPMLSSASYMPPLPMSNVSSNVTNRVPNSIVVFILARNYFERKRKQFKGPGKLWLDDCL